LPAIGAALEAAVGGAGDGEGTADAFAIAARPGDGDGTPAAGDGAGAMTGLLVAGLVGPVAAGALVAACGCGCDD
jgi:hypothetical protein